MSKLAFFSALALFLMVADTRFKIVQPLRAGLATVLYPVQWAMLQPLAWAEQGGQYFQALKSAQASEDAAHRKLNSQSVRANQVEQLALENSRLRHLLALRERVTTPAQAAQVLYDAADPYTRKVVVDRGLVAGVVAGSPVVDESGVLGQVTRVYPMISEVTLVTDRDQAIPVLNTRTGARGVAFGDSVLRSNALELRFMAADADVQSGDLLTTSGVDGVYPPGLPVARVTSVERRADSGFARINCTPVAGVSAVVHVMILQPLANPQVAAPAVVSAPQPATKGAKK